MFLLYSRLSHTLKTFPSYVKKQPNFPFGGALRLSESFQEMTLRFPTSCGFGFFSTLFLMTTPGHLSL